MTIGEKIQHYRKEYNMSQEQLGNLLNVSRQTISLWETDQTLPTVDNLIKLKEIFHISLDYLLSEDSQTDVIEPGETQRPIESYSFTYSADDDRKIYNSLYSRRIIRNIIIDLVLIVFCAQVIVFKYNPYELSLVLAFVPTLLMIYFTILEIYRLNKAKQTSAKKNINRVYRYDIYEDHFIETIFCNNEWSYSEKFAFSQMQHIQFFDRFITFENNNKLFVLKAEQIPTTSRLYLILKAKCNDKRTKKSHPGWTAVSIVLFVLSLLSILFAVIAWGKSLSFVATPDSGKQLWVCFFFVPIPVSSIIFAIEAKSKGMIFRKNMIAGIIMTVLLCLYGSMCFMV